MSLNAYECNKNNNNGRAYKQLSKNVTNARHNTSGTCEFEGLPWCFDWVLLGG